MNNLPIIPITPELIQVIEITFSNRGSKTVKTKPRRIKFNGQFITTESKKTVWRNIGFAKSALLNHLNSQLILSVYIKKTFNMDYVYGTVCKQIIRDLEKAGVVEYIEVDVETLAVQKVV